MQLNAAARAAGVQMGPQHEVRPIRSIVGQWTWDLDDMDRELLAHEGQHVSVIYEDGSSDLGCVRHGKLLFGPDDLWRIL